MSVPLTRHRVPRARAESRINVLLVDSSAADRATLRRRLVEAGQFRVAEPDSPQELDRLLASGRFQVVVSELDPWGLGELHVLERVRAIGSKARVVIVTAHGSERWAAEAIKRGAADYVPKTEDYLSDLVGVLAAVVRRRVSSRRSLKGVAEAPPDKAVYARILNGLSVNLAYLDGGGKIRALNDAWKQRAFGTPFQNVSHEKGVNYLEACEAVGDEAGAAIAAGLRSLLADRVPTFAYEYASGSGSDGRWYRLFASQVRDNGRPGAIVVHHDITHRRRSDEERFRLFERSLGLLCIFGFDGYMKRWNRAWSGVLGYSCDEMMSLRLGELLHPDDLPAASASIKKWLAGEEFTAVESRVRCKDGSYKWVLWNAVPSPEQKVFIATGQDITAHKRAEEQLRESEERFQLLASATNDAVWDWDLRHNRLWRNESYLQNYGVQNDAVESVIEWWRKRIHPGDVERILAAMPPPLHNGQQQWLLEYRLRRADGTYAHVYDRGFVIFNSEGEPVRMVGSIMDISQLKQTEERLRESEERFRLASRATSDAIWDWELSKDEVWRSEHFQTLFGYEPHEVGNDLAWWVDRIHPDDRQQVMAQIRGPDKSSQQCAFEYRFRRADGSYADVFDRGFVMHDSEGLAVRMIGSIMDISERRRAEEAAHLQQAELAHIARVSTMGEIATGLAHELNQPLTAISNYAESCAQAIAAHAPDSEQKVLSWIERISTNTHRAAQMIRRLRSFTRKGVPRREPVEVNELIEEVIELVEVETRRRGVRVRWQAGPIYHTTVDRIQIQQVLVNLLRNAYEAMVGNPPERRVLTISAEPRGDQVELAVEDRGEGIAAENLERVFEAFFTTKASGVGIGLAISRSIVEDHGGRLWVHANPQHGVTFRFTLPLSGASDVAIADRNGR